MAFSNPVDTLTLEKIVPQVVDTVLRGNVFTAKMLSKTKKFQAATQDFPIKYQIGTAVQSFLGMDQLPTSFTDTRVLMKFSPRFTAANVALAGTDILANNTAQKVLDLTQIEMTSRAQDLADGIGTALWSDGTGNNNKDFLGLGALVDDGSNVASIGGLPRSTYTTLKGTVTSSATLSLSTMRTLWNAIADAGGVQPTRAYTDYASWSLYEQLLQPQEKVWKEITMPGTSYKLFEGAQDLVYAGMAIAPDRKATAGQMVFVNEDFLDFYALDTDLSMFDNAQKVNVASKFFTGNSYNQSSNLGFYWTGFIKSINQLALNSFIICAGNLVTANPRRHGKLTGITGI